nr:hypothetical protein Itr_chr12CG24920 [Ipomoea trifida]
MRATWERGGAKKGLRAVNLGGVLMADGKRQKLLNPWQSSATMAMISLYPRILKSSPAIGFASVEGNVSFIHLFSLLCIEHFGFSFSLNVRLKLLFYNSSVLSFFAVRSAVFELICILCHRTGTDSKFSSAVHRSKLCVCVNASQSSSAALYTV